jgi:hypothetical protein
MEVPYAQDLQNCLSEWSKYERAWLGGRLPKRRFRPSGDRGESSGFAVDMIAAE